MDVNQIVPLTLSPHQLFGWCSQLASLGWLILILGPRRFVLLNAIPKMLIPLVLGLVYAGSILSSYFISEGNFNSLVAVRTLFENDQMLLAGWVHYLAFDLFVGSWISIQADKIGISRLIQAPILLATFMFGPLGFVIFWIMKAGLPTDRELQNV